MVTPTGSRQSPSTEKYHDSKWATVVMGIYRTEPEGSYKQWGGGNGRNSMKDGGAKPSDRATGATTPAVAGNPIVGECFDGRCLGGESWNPEHLFGDHSGGEKRQPVIYIRGGEEPSVASRGRGMFPFISLWGPKLSEGRGTEPKAKPPPPRPRRWDSHNTPWTPRPEPRGGPWPRWACRAAPAGHRTTRPPGSTRWGAGVLPSEPHILTGGKEERARETHSFQCLRGPVGGVRLTTYHPMSWMSNYVLARLPPLPYGL